MFIKKDNFMADSIKVFKDVIGWEDYYEVSNYGEIRSKDRTIIYPDGRKYFFKGQILKPQTFKSGYLYVNLNKNGFLKKETIHRLVAIAFLPNPDNFPQVNHKDEDKTNNFVWVNHDGSVDFEKSNLEWCNCLYNDNFGTRNQRISQNKGKPVIQKLNGVIVGEYIHATEAERQTGISQQQISKLCCNSCYIVNGKKYYPKTAGGFEWEFA